MSLFEQFKMDKSAEVDGVLLDYGSGGRIRIARAGGSNTRFLKAMERLQKQHKRKIDLDILDEDVALKAMVEIYADTIILGWESGPEDDPVSTIPSPKGDLAFTRDNVIYVLTELPELFTDIRQSSLSLNLFREAQKEADAGN